MSKTTYTDNTLATDPPGGKRHSVSLAPADATPPDERFATPKRRRASAGKSAAARKAAPKARKPAAKKAKARAAGPKRRRAS